MNSKIILSMFPYPSGNLHIGHVRNYAIGDAFYRYLLTRKISVFQPMGWDAFGLPAEKAAMLHDMNPSEWTTKNIASMKQQMCDFEFNYDWSREIRTDSYEFYTTSQLFFKLFYENKLIYRKSSWVNWDPVDCTVLSNEQVIDGLGWRSNAPVVRKVMQQWFFKTTDFAEQLLEKLQTLDWPSNIKNAQKQLIGKHEGFKTTISSENGDFEIFTLKPFYLKEALAFAVSFEHPLAMRFFEGRFAALNDEKDVLTNIKALNPCNGEWLPVIISKAILPNFGTGAIMCCAVDQRDRKILLEQNIDIERNITPSFLEPEKIFASCVCYNLKDWCVSRQRVWGCPIPIVECSNCGFVCQIDDVLSKTRLSFKTYELLEKAKLLTRCSKCDLTACSSTETLDTFWDSSWYFLAFLKENEKRRPVDYYIGGCEHATSHLLYSRAFIKALKHCGFAIDFDEPFVKLVNQGTVCNMSYRDANGNYVAKESPDAKEYKIEKMSKSKLNFVDLEHLKQKYGTLTLRFSILSDYPIEKQFDWDEEKVVRSEKFLSDLSKTIKHVPSKHKIVSLEAIKVLNEARGYYDRMKLNNAISCIHKLYNMREKMSYEDYVCTLLLIAWPIIPTVFPIENKAFPEILLPLLKQEAVNVFKNGELFAKSTKEEIKTVIKSIKNIKKINRNKDGDYDIITGDGV